MGSGDDAAARHHDPLRRGRARGGLPGTGGLATPTATTRRTCAGGCRGGVPNVRPATARGDARQLALSSKGREGEKSAADEEICLRLRQARL
jgi:hypothetical protein